METISIKLVTGEEILGRIAAGANNNMVKISHVRTLGLQQDNQGRVGLGMMEYVLSNKDAAIEIPIDKCVAIFKPSKEIENAYLQQTSGIQLT